MLLVSFFAISFFHIRDDYRRELGVQARMLAHQLAGEQNTEAFTQTLAQASVNPVLLAACFTSADSKELLAATGHAASPKVSLHTYCTAELGWREVDASAPVTPAHLPKPIGTVRLIGAVPSVLSHLGEMLPLVAAIVLLFGAMCGWIGAKLRRVLLRPLRQISSTAQRVSLYKDYSLRVTTGVLEVAPEEIASLIDSLNAMLKEIEDRDSRLMRKTVELEKARVASEAANAAKSQFLANISHELRTPLNAIIGFSTMLREQQFGPIGDDKYVEYARDIHDSGKHLLDIINDILDLSRAEAGKLSVKFEALQLQKLIDKALHIVAGQAHQGRIDIYTDIPEKMPKIVADRVRLVQILLNLLSNAIKFTEEGGKVIVRARVEAAKNGTHFFTMEVEDSGIGMSEEDIRKAFQAFNQADAGLNRKYEGTGLGLPLTKRLVELHHGKIKIESSKGNGTKVTVRLTSDPALLD
jgi:signal transduction histidine kinase